MRHRPDPYAIFGILALVLTALMLFFSEYYQMDDVPLEAVEGIEFQNR